MTITCRLLEAVREKKRTAIVIETDESITELNELKGAECTVKIEKKHNKRSLTANAYLWELCGKLADKLSDDGVLFTKDDVYINAIQQVGIYKEIPMQAEYADTLRKAWELHGTGWITEQVDYDGKNILVRCYYGSSTYNTKQMSRLIDSLIQDCDALGIDHRTPVEINDLLSLWETERTVY